MRRMTVLVGILTLLAACGTPSGQQAPDDASVTSSTSTTSTGIGAQEDAAPSEVDAPAAPPTSSTEEEDDSTVDSRSEGRDEKTPETVPEEEQPGADPGDRTTGEVPSDLLSAIITDAASKTSVPASSITVLRAEQVVWSDGSLGCPQPGQTYTQALVDGYWVELDAAGEQLDYRAAMTGYFVLCPSGGAPGVPNK